MRQWQATITLQWRHDGRHGVSYHQPHDYSTVYSDADQSKTSKLRITSFCAGNSPVTGAQMASNAENVSICWRHHVIGNSDQLPFQFDKQSIHFCLGLNISSAFHCLTDNNYHGTYTYSSANGARHRHRSLDCMYHGFWTIFSYQWLKCAFGAQTLL